MNRFLLPSILLPSICFASNDLLTVPPLLVVLGLVVFFTLILPQTKRNNNHIKLLSSIKKGDEVQLTCGIIGTINSIYDQFVKLEINSGTYLTVDKSALVKILPKGTIQ